MKKLALLLVVVVIALLGLPGLLGKLAQDELENQLELTKGNPAMKVSIGDYNRGWFSSTVRYEIGLTDEYLEMIEEAVASENAEKEGAKEKAVDDSLLDILSPFEMVSEVSHGPVGLLDGPFLGLFKSFTTESANNPRLNDFLAEANMPYLIKGYSTTSFLGSTAFDFEMPASTGTSGSDSLASKLNFSGATGEGNYSIPGSDGARIQMTTSMKNLSVKEDDSEFTLSDIKLTTDSTRISDTLWSGPSTTTIGLLAIKDNSRDDSVAVSMKDMAIEFDSRFGSTQQTVDGKMSYRVAEMQFAEQTVSDIEISVAMNEISIPAIEQYNQFMQDIAFAASEEPDTAQMLADTLPVMHEFLSRSPTLSLDPIKLTMNDEDLLADISLNIDGSSLPALDNFEIMDIALWMQMVSGKAGLTLSENMATLLAMTSTQSQLQAALGDQQEIAPEQINQMAAAQAPILIKTLVQQGMLQSADGQISTGVTFKNGELLLNGQPIPLEAMLGL